MKKIFLFLSVTMLLSIGTALQTSASSIHTVVKGDTLWAISQNNNVSVATLKEWNGLSSNLIIPGKELVLENTRNSSNSIDSAEITVTATAYTAFCKGCSGVTSTGIDLRANPNQKVIAVDPKVIPLGSRVWVEGYGEAIAGDIGGAIKGNKIDVFIPNTKRALIWGNKTVKIKILN
ncbi:3D domain-containing protein [Sporosarcina siberiensis]|uniref:3D domain-containing protein n=1 Tax=Sporosarcina siberiensis TaxID=1365606 RepID=A0ABW4SF06_9BACL